MDIYDASGNRIRLDERDFIAEGGEGKLYGVSDTVYKIYLDPAKVVPAGKLDELAMLDRPNIIRPLGPIFNDRNERIGFSMRKVPEDAVALSRLFTTSYWNSAGITPAMIARLVEAMRNTIAFIHAKGFLQVDGNEYNYMVSGNLATPYCIDVDSYQTPGYPASAIMPSIRDYTRSAFTQESDWFSFAIVAFQLFVGIHPFKGRHPDFGKNDFEGRIKAGISVFNKAVSYPSSVRDFSTIPDNYRRWFEDLFERGMRYAPPHVGGAVTPKTRKHLIQDGTAVAIRQIATFNAAVRRFRTLNGQRVIRVGDQVFVGNTAYDIPAGTVTFIMGERGTPLFVRLVQGQAELMDVAAGHVIPSGIAAQKAWVANNTLYLVQDDNLIEANVLTLGGRMIVAPGATRKILPQATQLYNGLMVENVLGKPFLLLPVAPGIMPIVAMPELVGYRIVDARYERGVAAFILGAADGQYRYARARFDKTFTRYDFDMRDDVEEINFTVLDKGIVVSIPRDGVIEIASSAPDKPETRIISDPQIRMFMRLVNDAGLLGFYAEQGIFTATLKP